MATEIFVRKLYDSFAPVDMAALEQMEQLKMNGEYLAVLTQPRNIFFHRKFFALLNVAYKAWDKPELEHKGEQVSADFEQFRSDVIILAGHYKKYINIKGELRLKAKSISFAKMDEVEFQKLYSSVVDVILQKVLTNYDEDDLQNVVDKVLGFV